MELNDSNLTALAGYLQQTLSPDTRVRKPAEDFLRSVEVQQGYAILLLTAVGPSQNLDAALKVAAAIAFKNFVKRNWKEVSSKVQGRLQLENSVFSEATL